MCKRSFCGVIVCALLVSAGSAAAEDQTPEDRRDLVFYPGDTERIGPLTRKLASNFWMDQKSIWSSPFQMDKKEATRWIGVGLVTGALIVTDRRTSHVLENRETQVRWSNNVSRIGAMYTVLPVMAGFYTYGAIADNQKARETGILGGEALLDGVVVAQLLKLAAGRNRPNDPDHPGNFFSGGVSFPSGHSIAGWTMASVVAHEYRNRKFVPIIAYSLAAVVSSARLGARQHYASDLFAGAAIGYYIGKFVVNTHEAHAEHHHGIVTPIVQPMTRTYGLSWTFWQ